MTRRRALVVPLAALVLAVVACSDDEEVGGRVTVLAASSLTEAFEEVATAFEAEHDGVDVSLSFDGSSALATQILAGAPGDVFASADVPSMDKVVDAERHVALAEPFAVNGLQIAVPRGNPAGVTSLADLAERDLTLALCATEVPCGAYAAEAFGKAGLPLPGASHEENVRGVLTKVALGEADAGIVYVTDIRANDAVEGIEVPTEAQVLASYQAVALADAPNPEAAAAFVAFLTGTRAQDILGAHGFGPPSR